MSNPSLVSKHFWTTIVVAVICGLAAGILGEIATRVYILKDFASLFYGDIDLSGLEGDSSGLVIRDARQVVVSQDLKISETVSSVRPLLVGIFKEIKPGAKTGYYDLNDPLFTALVITADGWSAAPVTVSLAADFRPADYVAIASDRRLYKIDKVADLPDQPGEVLILHLAGGNNWPVKPIMPRSAFSLGETLLAVPGANVAWPTNLTAWSRTAAVLSSESSGARLDLDGSVDGRFDRSFVFNLAGDLAALVADGGEIIPAFSYEPAWSALSRPDAPGRPFLGVNYLDLSSVKTATTTADRGALLYAAGSQPAVKKNSPAEAAGLKAGDIVTWVNNREIDASYDLADLLSSYRAGDEIVLTYRRSGVELEAKLRLGDLK